MGSNAVEVEPQIEIASYDASDTRPESAEDRPPSMATIRLSSSSELSILGATSPGNLLLAESAQQSAQVPHAVSNEGNGIAAEEAEVTTNESSYAEDIMEEDTETSMSKTKFQKELVMSASPTIRSRSDSSTSGGSAQVDWEELEKSEEQAPRDEGSDEVGNSRDVSVVYL